MSLRYRMFLGFALALGLVLPMGLALEYRMTERMSREWMRQQSDFVSELLEEKLVEPLQDVEAASRGQGHSGTWEQARLDLASDQAITWLQDDGHRVPVPLQALLDELREVPLMTSGYTFVMDTHGTLLACQQDGQVVTARVSEERTKEAFTLKETLIRLDDPIYKQPSDLVLLSVPRFGLAVGVIFPEKEIADRLAPLAIRVSQTAAVLLVVVWGLCYLLARRITRPLEELTQAVRRTVGGELDIPLMPSDIHEVSQLSQAFSKMRDDLAAYLVQIQRTSAETARVVRELELARTIQGNAAQTLTFQGWTATARSEPAREVGGDFMDLFPTEDGRLALLVGDVSGKGIPAALHTLLARSALKLGLTKTGSPAQALLQANDLLGIDNQDSVFVSALVAVLDPARGQMVWARAGHPTPLTENGPLSGPNGPPLGLVPEVDYRETISPLESQGYLFYTDGFPEAENQLGQFLSVAPLCQALQEGTDLWATLLAHRGAAEPSDDATAILLKPAP